MLPQSPVSPPRPGEAVRTLQTEAGSWHPLARHPKGLLSHSPTAPICTYTAAPTSFPQRWPKRGICRPCSHSLFPARKHLVSKRERQPQSPPCLHLPPPRHPALHAPRRPQQGTASSTAHSPPRTALTPSYSPGRKTLVSATRPALASPRGLLATADGGPAGVKVCLTAGNHQRLLAKGQDQSRASGHALLLHISSPR